MTKSRNGAKQHLASLRQGIEEEAAKVVPLIEKFTAARGITRRSAKVSMFESAKESIKRISPNRPQPSTNKMFNKNLSESGRVFMIFP